MKFRMKNKSGQSLVELCVGLMVFVPIVLLMMDCGVIMIGVATNDIACRDAARAASGGPPGLMLPGSNRAVGPAGSPYKRALNVVKDVYEMGGLLEISQSLKIVENVRGPVPELPHGGAVMGDVTVQTTTNVFPPFLIKAVVPNGIIELKNTQNYPYTYVLPGT